MQVKCLCKPLKIHIGRQVRVAQLTQWVDDLVLSEALSQL